MSFKMLQQKNNFNIFLKSYFFTSCQIKSLVRGFGHWLSTFPSRSISSSSFSVRFQMQEVQRRPPPKSIEGSFNWGQMPKSPLLLLPALLSMFDQLKEIKKWAFWFLRSTLPQGRRQRLMTSFQLCILTTSSIMISSSGLPRVGEKIEKSWALNLFGNWDVERSGIPWLGRIFQSLRPKSSCPKLACCPIGGKNWVGTKTSGNFQPFTLVS